MIKNTLWKIKFLLKNTTKMWWEICGSYGKCNKNSVEKLCQHKLSLRKFGSCRKVLKLLTLEIVCVDDMCRSYFFGIAAELNKNFAQITFITRKIVEHMWIVSFFLKICHNLAIIKKIWQ